MPNHDKNRSGRTAVAVGGGALLLWLLLRGKGWGRGDEARYGTRAASPRTTKPVRCRVRVDHEGIELDGAPADVSTVVSRCGEAGAANVLATGDAISGVVESLLQALRTAGVVVHLDTRSTRALEVA